MSLSPQWLDELRARVSLSGLIGRTTRLTKAGHEFKACCPFHNEKSPSFYVNDSKGFYHCFGCGVHGDAIRWLTDQRGLSFMDAVKELAGEAGMEVPAPDPRAAKEAEKRDSLHDVMAAAQAWFVEQLASNEGAKARAYLATRGFNDRTIERFGFGYAPEGRQSLKAALSRFPEAMLVEAGLRIVVDDDDGNPRDPYDRFRGRLMLPIEDARGRVIAFGGRILDAEKKDAPKYLNSPDTPLFDKGSTLYNLHRAGPASRRSGRIVVVEGYMDVIALAAAGIEDAVAPLGTALTERQLEMLWRLVDNPVLCFDGDAAGQRAAMRAVKRALPSITPQRGLKIVTLPAGMDPDDVVKMAGPAGFEVLIDVGNAIFDYIWHHEISASPVESPEQRANFKSRIESLIDLVENRTLKHTYINELREQFDRFFYANKGGSKRSTMVKLEDLDPRLRKRRWLARTEKEVRDKYMHNRLGASIAMGFMIRPNEIRKYDSLLATVKHLDGRINAMLDEVDGGIPLSAELFHIAFSMHSVVAPDPDEFDRLRFPYAWPGHSEQRANESLDAAIQLYSSLARARQYADHAQKIYETQFDKDSEIEQRRLREVVETLFARLKNFVREFEAAE